MSSGWLLVMVCVTIVAFGVGWIIGRRKCYKEISELYKREVLKLVKRIDDIETKLKNEHELQHERASIDDEMRKLQEERISIRKRISDQAKADVERELHYPKRFPRM